jgi:actin related protein 2/3 complex subunit 2
MAAASATANPNAQGMILLEPGNRILAETCSSQIIRENPEEKREPIDVRLCDFDDTSYRVVVDAKERDQLRVSISIPCYNTVKDHGANAGVAKAYGAFVAPEADQGYDVTLVIDLNAITGKPEALVQSLQLFKANLIGGVFDHFFSNLLKTGSKPLDPFRFDLRADTNVFILPGPDRVTVIYSLDFKERVDRAVARVFLQEFVDARRTLGAAPPCAFGPNPPPELKVFGVTEPAGNLGFLTFSVLKSHIDRDKKDKVIAVLQVFRNYLQYHIKCSKSYFHSRMRLRVAALIAVLNRAKMEPLTEGPKRTITGRTFTRAA